ncbi:hypothetical protein PITCH_A190001 [uncultured Desulfobacterium sp.]|uniref:Uncharacterized protein n=1 Tax=uncultured Desulfobacterium sp. TaxID=201089 RepID=A0A445MVC6_9BACT|nr:hypothetical protein PITCH_A190001 [uncultured Desulfobacterium sp.]
MPEITSRNLILAKLQEFDERLDGAFVAAEKMVGLKDDAAKLVEDIHETYNDSSKLLERLKKIRDEWQELRAHILAKQEQAEQLQQEFQERFNQTIDTIEDRFITAKQELTQSNEASRSEHKKFAEASSAHAEKAAENSKTALKSVAQAEQLLAAVTQDLYTTINSELDSKTRDLHTDIDTRLTRIETLTNNRLEHIEIEWKKQVAELKKSMEDNLKSFKDEVKDDLLSHKKGVENQITEFLVKQNLLIQNLTQQIDGFQRATQALATEQQIMYRKIGVV